MRGAAQLLSSCPLVWPAGRPEGAVPRPVQRTVRRGAHAPTGLRIPVSPPLTCDRKVPRAVRADAEPEFTTRTRGPPKKIRRKSGSDGNPPRSPRVLLHVRPGASGAPGRTPSSPGPLPSGVERAPGARNPTPRPPGTPVSPLPRTRPENPGPHRRPVRPGFARARSPGQARERSPARTTDMVRRRASSSASPRPRSMHPVISALTSAASTSARTSPASCARARSPPRTSRTL